MFVVADVEDIEKVTRVTGAHLKLYVQDDDPSSGGNKDDGDNSDPRDDDPSSGRNNDDGDNSDPRDDDPVVDKTMMMEITVTHEMMTQVVEETRIVMISHLRRRGR